MTTETSAIQKIKEQGLVPLFYHDDIATCTAVTGALYEAGVRCIEFTNRGAKALEIFGELVKEKNKSMPGLLLGIGTIKTDDEATAFLDAGADFLVSPVFDSSVCDTAYSNKTLWMPGCMTPTEIHVAQQAGCNMIKLFPGNLLTPGFVEAIMPLFTGLDFIVTGGVDTSEENIKAWFKSGVTAIGLGSKLITKSILQDADYEGLKRKTKEVISIIDAIKAAR